MVQRTGFWLGFFTILLSVGLTGCGNTQEAEERVEVIPTKEGGLADIYRNPISLDTPDDTVNVAKIEFEEDFFDFGRIEEGEVVHHRYKFINAGRKPLLISNARSTCGCTIPKWPETPIAPGESGVIDVRFDSKNKENKINKPITIIANTFPSETKIYLRGFVIGKK